MVAEGDAALDCDAVVVGGGFAGVTAARELCAAGFRTTLLEARDRLGGRTWTRQFGDDTVEMGGTWIHWNQPHVWSELTRHGIGIQQDDWSFDRAMFGSPPRSHPPEEAFAKLRALFRDFAEDGSSLLPHPHDPLLLSSELAARDQMSMEDRLEQMQLAPAERDWLTGLLYEIAGSPLQDAGLLAVLRWLALCNWNVENWYDTNKFRPKGGTAAVIGAMLADQRVEVRLSSPVVAVDAAGDSVDVRMRDGETIRASAAIVAVPVNLWPTIDFAPSLPRGHVEAARAGMGKPHQDKVWARVRGPIGRVFGQLPAPAPLNFFWTYQLDGDTQLIMGINANPVLDVNNQAQVAKTLREYIPEIEEVIDVCAHDWAADEYSRGGNTCYRPGQLTRHLGDLQQPWGRVAFATADIASGWMGYIDGAIESGIRAARYGREMCERGKKTPT